MRYVGGVLCFWMGLSWYPVMQQALHPKGILLLGSGIAVLAMFACGLWEKK